VDPTSIYLTEKDTALSLHLKSSSTDTVRYRIQLNAPHLQIATPRGEFTGETILSLPVSTGMLKGRDVPGSVQIFTTLGNTVVNAPIHVGVTGSYHGILRYDGGSVPLGDTRFSLDLIENTGVVTARVDSARSLLFPKSTAGDTTGRGSYTVSSGLDLTLNQRIDSGFGAARNHFRRSLGRRLHLSLQPATGGNLNGTFTETAYGLFSQPVTTKGTVLLEYQPTDADPAFNLAADPDVPASPSKTAFMTPADVPTWATAFGPGTCDQIVCGTSCAADPNRTSKITSYETTYYQPLINNMPGKTSQPFDDIANACRASAGVRLVQWQNDPAASKCAFAPALACALTVTAEQSTADAANARTFDRIFKETVASGLLVAKDEVVHALYDSLSIGSGAEGQRYDHAMTALDPVATWVLQASILEYMRSMVPGAPYASASSLADLLLTMSTIDGERARIGAVAPGTDQTTLATQAQQRALLTYLETMSLSAVLDAWGSAPPAIAAGFAGVLTPLDRGFAALLQGANAFGVPAGFVPFIFAPDDVPKSGPTNFQQMLSDATAAVTAEQTTEMSFITNKRTYEADNQALQRQLSEIRTQFDLKLKETCGSTFDPNAAKNDADWASCGSGGNGTIGELRNQVQEAGARLRSAETRIRGMQDKIAIDRRALAQTQKVHEETLQFIDKNGHELEALAFSEGLINAMEKLVDSASNAVTSFGASIAAGGFDFAMELARGGLEQQKQHLQTAQQMRFEQANAQIELINGMANIQKETIDLAQFAVDIQQDVIGMLGTQLRVKNALAQAHSLFDERGRSLALVGTDPANDPTFRILRDKDGLELLAARAYAQQRLYLAGRALEYEINTPLSTMPGSVLRTSSSHDLTNLQNCLGRIFSDWKLAFGGSPQEYVTTVSVRKMLGITGPRTDEVTTEQLSEGDQFRRLLLRNENIDGQRGVGIAFSTDLLPGNMLWSTDVCVDRIASVQAQLVGDFLGDNQATVKIITSGDAVMRACDSDALTTWSFGPPNSIGTSSFAVIQAGVNTFGDSPPNSSLYGQSVARSAWQIVIPGPASAPLNSDLDVGKIDDIVLKFGHKALPRRGSALSVDLSCLGG